MWYNCVQSVHVTMIQIYKMTVFSEIVCPRISGTWIGNNYIMCNSICVTVIHVHGITMFGVTNIYMKYFVTWNTLSSVLECSCNHDICTCNNGIQNHDNSHSYNVQDICDLVKVTMAGVINITRTCVSKYINMVISFLLLWLISQINYI